MSMVIKITTEQSEKVNALIRDSCCNCADDSCLLLEDSEEHSCVQLICKYGIYCNYFLKAVLPADRNLYDEILNYNKNKNGGNQ